MRYRNKKGQAIVELALFGSLILMGFGALLSYMQRSNEQQYVQMEAFRRALEKASTYRGEDSGGAGASVQYSLIETRRLPMVGADFGKNSAQTFGSSASIFWAVPEVGSQPENLVVYRINQDEKQGTMDDLLQGRDRKLYYFTTAGTMRWVYTSYEGSTYKQEDTTGISNVRQGVLQDTIHTFIPYYIVKKDSDDPANDTVESGTFWDLWQGGFRDTDGQYKYSEESLNTDTYKERTWATEF